MTSVRWLLLFSWLLNFSLAAAMDLAQLKKLPPISTPPSWEAGSSAQSIGPDDFVTRLSAGRINKVFKGMQPDMPVTMRGAKESSLYARLAPSVVMIVTEQGIGSGTIISADGTILTNWHVVSSTDWVGVVIKPKQVSGKLTKKDVRYAKVIKVDQVADLALIKLVAVPSGLKHVALAVKDAYQVGADVHAIGHPNEQVWTYTKGFISQIRNSFPWKSEEGTQHKADVIQTQTPINPGNSGGPLFTDDGKLIGINTMKAEGEGLNFAVSVADVRRFLSRDGNREATVSKKAECKVRHDKPRRDVFDNQLGDLVRIDTNCDGQMDAFLFEPLDKKSPLVLVIYGKNDEISEIVGDVDRDGKWDTSLHYEEGNPNPVAMGFHPDGELKPSYYEPYKEDKD